MSLRRAVLVMAGAMALAACGSSGGSDSAAPPDDSVSATSTVVPETSNTSAAETTAPTTSAAETTAPPTSPPTVSSAPITTAPKLAVTNSAEVQPECTRIDDFDADDATWFIVNDGVMGGRSNGRFSIADSTMRFEGAVVTAGGGFTSVRLRLDGAELAGSDRVRIRLRADDRTYSMTFEDDQQIQGRSISHGADLPSAGDADDDGYSVVELAYAALDPTIFGRQVDAEPFRADAAAEIGFIIADGIDGEFVLAVDWVDACA